MESDVIEPDADKDRSKSKGAKPGAKVVINGEAMTVKEMQEKMGSPGKEFFQSGRAKTQASSSSGPRQQTVTVEPALEKKTRTKKSTAQEEPASETEGEDESPAASQPEARKELVDRKTAGKWLKLLDAGWFPVRTKDEARMYLHSPDSDSKSSLVPFSQSLWKFFMEHLTPIGKDAMESEPSQQDRSEEAVSKGTSLLAYMTTKATKDVPLIRNQLGKISFMQQALYDLGWMTFLKLSKAPGLLPDDLWRVTLSDDPTPDGIGVAQKARELFAGAFEEAEDTLLRSMDAANEIARLDHELTLESGRLMKARLETQSTLTMAKFYEERLRVALACMPAVAMQEYVNRTTVMALANTVERGEAAAVKAQIQQEGTQQA